MRSRRKTEHIQHVLRSSLAHADFSDIRMLHNCLPGTQRDVNLTTEVAGFSIAAPLFLNAVTGGAFETEEVNAKLALLGKRLNIPMALGSQKAALDDAALERTYQVVRSVYPEGILFANVSAKSTVEEALRAVGMINADALQLHLNAPQEAVMGEGDREYSPWAATIRKICKEVQVPVIVKETGFGMATEQARLLVEAGAAAVDVSGTGGTNFIRIEAERAGIDAGELAYWGIPTPIALLEVLEAVEGKADVIASGGINTSLSIVKSLSMGASAVGIAALPLRLVMQEGVDGATAHLEGLLQEIRTIMAILGAETIPDLRKVPLVIQGNTYRWLKSRGFQPEKYARREFHQLS
jgi:isopentenyl-diphosphate Delta-isomerase